jgi:high affinity Mn2+ porin
MWTGAAGTRSRRIVALASAALGVAALAGRPAVAAAEGPAAGEPAAVAAARDEAFAVHGQLTYVEQETNAFHAPYRGPNSLSPSQGRQTFDATLCLGRRLWPGAEGWLSPEVDQGFGLDDTLGLAGFPSGEAYKRGSNKPYLRLPRVFVRQTLDLDDSREARPAGLLQLAGSQSGNRVVVTVGKFSVGDVFDTNQYAHDPRGDFMNWAAVDAGVFDYAADAWGYSVGAAVEWWHDAWTLRGGAFALSNVPNSEHLEPGGHEFQMLLELERRYTLGGRPGRLLLTGFDSRGRMGLLDEAVQRAAGSGQPVDIAAVRRYRSRLGAHLSLEQQLTRDLGLFARVGGAGGNVETYEFTDIDRSLAAGLSLRGARWGRADDTLAAAAIVSGLSAARQRYLDAGGLGILVGDGRLARAGRERIVEAYYAARTVGQVVVTLDYQFVTNPAYNRDRGPVSVFAARVHAQF